MPLWPNRKGAPDTVTARAPGAFLVQSPGGLSPSLSADYDGSSSSDSDVHPSRNYKPSQQPRRHARSMSNPFPSLFPGAKKKRPDGCGEDPCSDSDDGDLAAPGGQRDMSKRPPLRKGHVHQPSTEFRSGNCVTCGSHTRWPKELSTFRCTVCSTLNDLPPPRGHGEARDASPSWPRASPQTATPTTPQTPSPSPSVPISCSQTKRIVRQCLRSYLINSLGSETEVVLARESSPASKPPVPQGLAERAWKPGQPHVPKSDGLFRFPAAAASLESRPSPAVAPFAPPKSLPFDTGTRSYSSSYPDRPSMEYMFPRSEDDQSGRYHPTLAEQEARKIFRPLEEFILASFGSFDCVNSSFSTKRAHTRVRSESVVKVHQATHRRNDSAPTAPLIADIDPKMLLAGNIAENSTWWTGAQPDYFSQRPPMQRRRGAEALVSHGSPHMDWNELQAWYSTVVNAADGWKVIHEELEADQLLRPASDKQLKAIEYQLLAAQDHIQRVLLRATENLLKRPGRPILGPDRLRFLLIALHNPLLHRSPQVFKGWFQVKGLGLSYIPNPSNISRSRDGSMTSQRLAVIRRILGLLSHSSTACHHHLIAWLARLNRDHFKLIKDVVGDFLTYRLKRIGTKPTEIRVDITGGLVPRVEAESSTAAFHAALGGPNAPAASQGSSGNRKMTFAEDWQLRAASRVMALIFAANNHPVSRPARQNVTTPTLPISDQPAARENVQRSGQILPTSDFYNPLIDSADLILDFEAWEARRPFSFCQHPFLLSISAKTRVLEHEAKRQMARQARDAFFDSIMNRKRLNQYWVLDVRRDCLVEDSLKGVSEIIGSGSDDIKKRLRIAFSGEEGIDQGGLRKEWFLLLIREVFNPDNGMFLYEDDSNFCYFNPHSFERSDQFFLVGVVMGLAIYNSTILDIPLPPFTFRKLLATGPVPPPGSPAHRRPTLSYTLDDLAEFRPSLARGLQQLLDYDGNVEETFGLDFVIDTDKYGTTVQVPLMSGGANRPVTNENRREYVDLYVRYALDAAVSRQFEPFKRGFYTVCSGNALSLFQPEEIELLVRGSDAPLDIASLRAAAVYENWATGKPDEDGSEPAVRWFWESFEAASSADQRRLLLFVTGSDRIPAAGASSLSIKVSCLGDDCERFPIARTCFNMIVLWRYGSRDKLEKKLWTAVHESEGFGLR